MAISGIYKYQNKINNKIYIGKAQDIGQRRRDHRYSINAEGRDNCVFHKALKKYGEDNFIFEIIEYCSKEELDEKEQYWISFYQSKIPNGYNMTNGGDGGQGELFRKPVLQYSLLGDFIQEFESASEAARQLNCFTSNITAACRGETASCANFQWKYKDDNNKVITIVPAKGGKIVIQYDKNMNYISLYSSAKEASEITGVNVGGIRHCCTGRAKTAGGFIWKYYERNELNE